MNQELPMMHSTTYASTTTDGTELLDINQSAIDTFATGGYVHVSGARRTMMEPPSKPSISDLLIDSTLEKMKKEKEMANQDNRRYVQVFLVDPDEKMPLEKAVLHKGEPMLTDLSDEELFFSIPVMELLKTHNSTRETTKDPEASGSKAKCLKPVRIKDLSMTVVTIASF